MPRIVSFDEQLGLLCISGDEDRSTSGRRRRALSCALRAQRDVCVDVSGLAFADSSLVVDLAVLAQRLRAEGRRLSVRGPQPHIRTLIEMVGLHRMPSVAVEPAP